MAACCAGSADIVAAGPSGVNKHAIHDYVCLVCGKWFRSSRWDGGCGARVGLLRQRAARTSLLEVLLVFTSFQDTRHDLVRFFGVFLFCRSPCCVVSSVMSPKQQRFCFFAPPLVGLSVMNKGTDFYVSRLRVCCSMVLSITLPRSAAFRVFCIASSLYSSLADFRSGERRLFLSLRRRSHLVSDVDRRETGLFPRKTKTSLSGSFFFLKKNGEHFQLGEAAALGAVACLSKHRRQHGWTCPQPHGGDDQRLGVRMARPTACA